MSDAPSLDEAERIRQEYAARRRDQRIAARYRFTSPGHLLLVQERERALLALLDRHGFAERLGSVRVLDVGCGSGGTLLDLLRYGVPGDRLSGIDLDAHDIADARARLPLADLSCGDATTLPYPSASFDIVLQVLVLSTILAAPMRGAVAQEMRRVVRPDGLIISYDLRWPNPDNRALQPVTRRELATLFPDMVITSRSLTLAPPLARALAPHARWLALLLQAVPVLRSHLLAGITPWPGSAADHRLTGEATGR